MGITLGDLEQIRALFRKANGIRGKAKLRIPILKAGSRAPMLCQLNNLLSEAGIRHMKPAELIKKVLVKGTPVSKENVRKVSSAPPMSSHHGVEQTRRRGRIPVEEMKDSTNSKLSGNEALEMLKWALSQKRA